MTTVKSLPGIVCPTLVISILSKLPVVKTGKRRPRTKFDVVELAEIDSEHKSVPLRLIFTPTAESVGGVLMIAKTSRTA